MRFRADYNLPQEFDEASIPKLGDVVSFCYFRYGPSGPVDSRVLRVRTDITWREVLRGAQSEQEHNTHNTQLRSANAQSMVYMREHEFLAEDKRITRPHGYWNADEGRNVREFLDNYAKARNLDPLRAETWYNFAYKDLQDAVRPFFLLFFLFLLLSFVFVLIFFFENKKGSCWNGKTIFISLPHACKCLSNYSFRSKQI